MKTLKSLIMAFALVWVIYGCSSTNKHASIDPNLGNIEIEIRVETGKDSLARTPDGNLIGKIDKNGFIYDMSGNKIGQRKPTTEELIRQIGY